MVISLLLTSFLARHIGQAGFGHLMVAMALVSVLLCIAELGMQGITQRDLVHAEGESETLGSVFFTRMMVGALCYVGLMIYSLAAPREQRPLLVIYGSLLLTHACTVMIGWMQARHYLEAVAWAQFLGFLISAAFMGAGLIWGAPLWYFAATHVVECWAAIVIAAVMYRRRGGYFRPWNWSLRRTRGLLRESWFELASQLALLMLFRLDTIMVQFLRGAADAGVYGAAVRVSEVVYFLPNTLGTACLSALVALRKRDPLRYHRRLTEYFGLSIVIAAVCALSLVIASPPLIPILFGKDFTACVPILVVHAWAFIPYTVGTMRTVYFTAEGKLWLNLPSVAAAVVLNAFLNWLWIPTYGGVGAAWATLIAYTAAWVVSSFILRAGRDVPLLVWEGLKGLPTLAMQGFGLKTLKAALRPAETERSSSTRASAP